MRLRTPLPSSFETLISDLLEEAADDAEVPRPSHPFSLNSLEAAWEAAASARAAPRGKSGAEATPRRAPYSDDGNDVPDGSLFDPHKIRSELGLHSGASEAEIVILRREFALRNHPDRVPAELRDVATRRMMIANDLMDQHIARLRQLRD
jgi:hypothetical protein